MLNINKENFSSMEIEYNTKKQIKIKKATSYSDLRFCFVEKGWAIWKIDGKDYKICEGNIILLTHLQKRHFVNHSQDGFKMQVLILKRQSFINTRHLAFLINLTEENRIFNDEYLFSILKNSVLEYRNKNVGYYEIISSDLTRFLITLERKHNFSLKNSVKTDKQMVKILDYIDNNICEDINLKSVSKLYNMTESSFSRCFLKHNGITFKNYVTTRKIEHAVFLLNTTKMNVVDIGYECGFSSISGFYDAFKKVTGTTPNKISAII